MNGTTESRKAQNSERYEGLNVVRAVSAIGIVLMHVRANSSFEIHGFIFDEVIDSLTNITYLFMLLSAFSMCCGYYQRIKDGTFDIEKFYIRRYLRIWPFFAILCTLELAVEHNINALYEWFADLSLAFGMLPNANISVVGVGWFLGIIFVFYMIFPYFCYLMGNKRRAWFTFAVTIILNVLCRLYFFNGEHVVAGFMARTNFVYCSVYFAIGGLIYLYRNELRSFANRYKLIVIIMTGIAVALYYVLSRNDISLSVVFVLITILGISGSGMISSYVIRSRLVQFISNLSMEIYLCHMFVFRIAERIGIGRVFRNDVLNYCVISIMTLIGSIVVSFAFQKIWELAIKKFKLINA